MSICIVGNGASVLKNKNGHFIDSCDCVVRMKQFVTAGYEDYIGRKIDIYVSKWFSWFENIFPYRPRNMSHVEHVKEFWFLFCDPNLTINSSSDYISNYITYSIKNGMPLKDGDIKKHLDYVNLFNIPHDCLRYMSLEVITDLADQLSLSTELISDKNNNTGIIEPSAGLCTIMMMLSLNPDQQIYVTGFDSFLNSSWYWDNSHRINPRCHNYLKERLILKRLICDQKIVNIDNELL